MIREMIKWIYPKKPLSTSGAYICFPPVLLKWKKGAVRDSAEQAGAKEV